MIRQSMVFLVLASGCSYRLTREQLQGRIEQRFPQVVPLPAAGGIELKNPQVSFPGEDGTLALDLDVGHESGSSAHVSIAGLVTYEKEQAAFYLREPRKVRVSNLRLADANLGKILEQVFNALLPSLLGRLLDGLPVYQLDDKKPEEAKVKQGLRSVRVRDGALLIEM
jgi:hypothetical protein